MEISAIEIKLLCSKINSSINNYSVSSVYSMEGGMLLRLRHSTKVEQFIAISSFATWLTRKNLSLPAADSFVSRVRDSIERCKLLEVRQEGIERIATFKFSKRTGEISYLHAEFFGGGNLILTDEKNVILDVKKTERFRHRSVAKGETFVMPPPRGIALDQVSEKVLILEIQKLNDSSKDRKEISAIRWFGRAVGTSRKFVQEIFFRSRVLVSLPAISLSPEQLASLARESSRLVSEIESSSKGYVLLPSENIGSASDEKRGPEVDVCPIVPSEWKSYVKQGLATIENFESYGEALDQAQVQGYVIQTRLQASLEVRRRVAELESAIQKQEALVKNNEATASELRLLASSLMSNASSQDRVNELVSKLQDLGVIEKDHYRPTIMNFVKEPRARLDSFQSERALGSRLFDEAKKFEEANAPIARIKQELSRRKDEFQQQAFSTEERAEKRREFERRGRQWFERYRWFVTSDDHLAVGGRDATSNSIIINKYLDQPDAIFHADIHGSPFFVLKGGSNILGETDTGSEIAMEVAEATASFSRAWKEDLGSADAYWVLPNQVKKSAPSGEYLPRGSFFIEGKKNFVRHVRVELAVGVTTLEELKRMKSLDQSQSIENSDDKSKLPVVVCGPEKSLARYCRAIVKIAPGKERSSSVARKVKQLLVSKIRDDIELKDRAKRISLDDIVRALPSGSHKIVSQKQNN